MEYRLTTQLGSGEVVHTLENARLVVEQLKSGRREEVPFSQIRAINLRQEMEGVWSARISRTSGSSIRIPGRHFVGMGRFEDRGLEYSAFVTRLMWLAQAANPRIRFVGGSNVLFGLGVVCFVLSASLSLAYAVGFLVHPTDPPPVKVIAAVPIALMVGTGFMRQGRAKPFDPVHPPAHLLPPQPAMTT